MGEKQDAKCKWFVSRLKSKKQCLRMHLTGCNAPSKVRVIYFEILLRHETLRKVKRII